ncbi:DUF1674 domain-containing protein [Brevundimonas balnearis]|uniref:DUF1674 domain-containing protein n=1 Tax=Brevundimonas balnearis TaxID=1572858 RepID=A0ABV6R574_9CAUL
MTEQPTPTADDGPEPFNTDVPNATPERPISAVARQALLEAAARRRADSRPDLPPEDGGPRGPEPTRYGDWEKKGLAIDF